MFAEIRYFLTSVAYDWHHASTGTRYAALIGGAAFMAVAAGLCAL